MLLRDAGQHVRHLQKALEQMSVKLTEVASDVTGVTGLAIIEAILAGEHDPDGLAGRRNVLCERTRAGIARALEGSWRAEHLCALEQAVALYEFYHQQMRECDAELEAHLRTFAGRADGRPSRAGRVTSGGRVGPTTWRSRTSASGCTGCPGWT